MELGGLELCQSSYLNVIGNERLQARLQLLELRRA